MTEMLAEFLTNNMRVFISPIKSVIIRTTSNNPLKTQASEFLLQIPMLTGHEFTELLVVVAEIINKISHSGDSFFSGRHCFVLLS